MKKKLFKSSLFLFLILLLSCKSSDVSPDDSLAGTFKNINDPILCALPTMSDVKIKDTGLNYKLTCRLNNTSTEVLSGITVKKTDSTSTLFYDGVQIGSFSFMKYTDLSNGNFQTREGMVLMVRFDNKNKHFEFMGRK